MITKKLEKILLESKIDDRVNNLDLGDSDKSKIKDLNNKLNNKSKYVDFLIKHYKVDNIVELINNFESVVNKLNNKDIFKYSIDELNNMLDGVKSKSDIKKEVKSDVDKIFEDDDVLILNPKTHGASCLYGKGTKWCISAKDIKQHWSTYTTNKRIKFYFAFNKKLKENNPLYKVAIAVYPNGKREYWNAEDKKISKPDFL
jgi:hypothetical protein